MNHPVEGMWNDCPTEERLHRISSECADDCRLIIDVENPFGNNYYEAEGIIPMFNLIQSFRNASPDLFLSTPNVQPVPYRNDQYSSEFWLHGNIQHEVAAVNSPEHSTVSEEIVLHSVPYSISGTIFLHYNAEFFLNRIVLTINPVLSRKRPARIQESLGGMRSKKRKEFARSWCRSGGWCWCSWWGSRRSKSPYAHKSSGTSTARSGRTCRHRNRRAIEHPINRRCFSRVTVTNSGPFYSSSSSCP
mmetsp:Transcript_49609/g.86669  ORF Transcript_49609/g.86669 Transcript_49609/m.86669 type:complete len:247 (-) Transcript_49609:2081-2821(-)